jgi:hypothetical protein
LAFQRREHQRRAAEGIATFKIDVLIEQQLQCCDVAQLSRAAQCGALIDRFRRGNRLGCFRR